MKKNQKLNSWLWKWHFIAGLISLPFIFILSVTGAIYLFKADYEKPRQQHIKEVVAQGKPLSLQKQLEIANINAHQKPNAIVLTENANQATEFISGRFGGKSSSYVNPYSGKVMGIISAKKTDMFKVRKLHGELLMGKFGTKIIELIASWMIILIITGLYVWWPAKGFTIKGFFVPRTKDGKRIFFRDLHSISGFWISSLLLLILAGGLPWTDVFGANFKQFQKITNTGYPATWDGHQLESQKQKEVMNYLDASIRGIKSQKNKIPNSKNEKYAASSGELHPKRLNLDQMVTAAKALRLPGIVTLHFPKGPKGVFSVSNKNPSDLSSQKKIHFDQYSGKQVLAHNWQDVGILMRGRMWVMAFHQGEFGAWNWWLMLFTAVVLAMMSISALVSYTLRKRKGNWGIPKVSSAFKVGYGILVIIAILALVFPLFGASLILLLIIENLRKKVRKKHKTSLTC